MIGEAYDQNVNAREAASPGFKAFADNYFAYFDNEFRTSDSTGYSLTAAYANACFENGFLGLSYRSVQNNGVYNVALKKETEENGLIKLIEVYKFKIKAKKDNPRSADDYELISEEICSKIEKEGIIVWDQSE